MVHQHRNNNVKLRLLWNPSQAHVVKANAERKTAVGSPLCQQCFNESVPLGGFLMWRQRLQETKFHCDTLRMSYLDPTGAEDASPRPLQSEEDWEELVGMYNKALTHHSKPSTFRVKVLAAPLKVLQERRRNMASPVASAPKPSSRDTSKLNFDGSSRDGPATTSCKTPPYKKPRLHENSPPLSTGRHTTRGRRGHVSTTALPAGQDLCWDVVLQSIVKTVNQHHFGSRLLQQGH
mmetsp:Transcript_23862/g.52259  ORF Transcript_23862/g.52259 Transcript_23862/m.52259 type:complete len:235 (-) Transcript_23862:651-1355(-)|eukprot:CAMPEP_0202895514 /NCGR_PEP_ID=MMETSP1392-20130828/4691_1 /ASSEMBLY_ACC=CAM_ASM_000868 /TAXON_ID=225041 /ORGANISM="Chlamydomonas chlamydogama, Strain SAG 11-48b" /LENGTH=234 /DNA_ID=CAMNT_0049580539 /DNA_START=175 /DNA_END=879 /DNA_ORIENTATION=-